MKRKQPAAPVLCNTCRHNCKDGICQFCGADQSECMHGYNEKSGNCLTCHKSAGQCDYGGCTAAAEVNLKAFEGNLLLETRPVCRAHAETIQGFLPAEGSRSWEIESI